jgi:esterase/lipase
MPSAANRAKAKWNASNYVQIKVSVYPEVAVAFKGACTANGVSMAGVLSQFMGSYSAAPVVKATATAADPLSNRKKRRKLVGDIARQLEMIKDAEEQAMGNTPDNLRGAPNFEITEGIVATLGEILDALGGVY